MINLSQLKWQLLASFMMLMRIRMVSNTHHRPSDTRETTFTSRAWETQKARRAKKTLWTWGARRSLSNSKSNECYCKTLQGDTGWFEILRMGLSLV